MANFFSLSRKAFVMCNCFGAPIKAFFFEACEMTNKRYVVRTYLFALVSLTHKLPANLVLRHCGRFCHHLGQTCMQSHNLAKSFQSTLLRKKGSTKKIRPNQLENGFTLLFTTIPFESKEFIRIVESVVDQISAGVSLRESDSAYLY